MDTSGWHHTTVTVQARTGADPDGKPTWGTAFTVNVMEEGKQVRVRNATSGEEVMCDTILLSQDQAITAGSRVWFEGADTTDPNKSRTVQASRTSPPSRVDGRVQHEAFL